MALLSWMAVALIICVLAEAGVAHLSTVWVTFVASVILRDRVFVQED